MGTPDLMGEWEIEDQLAPRVAQETKGTREKMGNLVLMAPRVQLEPLDKEELWACQGSVGRGACLACLARRAHPGRLDPPVHREIKVRPDLWDPPAPMAPSGSLAPKVQLVMMVLQDGTVLSENGVIVETLDLQVCQAPRVPLERLAQWVPQEMQDKEEIRVLGVL